MIKKNYKITDNQIKQEAENKTYEIFGELDDFQDRTDGFIDGANWMRERLLEEINDWLLWNNADYEEANTIIDDVISECF